MGYSLILFCGRMGRIMHLFTFLCVLSGSLELLVTVQGSGSGLEVSDGLRKDAEALLVFRREIENDPSGALRDWGAQANPCRWHGVECARVPVRSLTSEQQGLGEEEEDRVVALELWGLELEGFISAEIGKLSALEKLAIVGNKLRGRIPVEIRDCQKLSTLDLRANRLSGPISLSLADLPRLEVLKLSENRLAGTLSVLFADRKSFNLFHFLEDKETLAGSLCPRLQVLDLAKNEFTGKISTVIGRCTQLSEVSLNDNRLRGSIPATLSAIPQLRSLFLNHNLLDGPLPPPIAVGCKKLVYFNVADNYLTGSIPFEFAAFAGARLGFNFSNNHLEGSIPLGKWRVQQMAMEGLFSGNLGLCGWPLTPGCEQPQRSDHENHPLLLTPCGSLVDKSVTFLVNLYRRMEMVGRHIINIRERGRIGIASYALRARRSMAEAGSSAPSSAPTASGHKNKHTARKWALGLALGIVAGALAAAIVATIIRLFIFYMHKAPYLQGPIIFHPNISPKMLLFLEKDESLSEAELVGEGGAGRVYKAQLENEMVVAVKSVAVKEDQKGRFGKKQIQAELETLGCVRHRNLVVLLAYVHRPDCHLLLYEYMQNGSLHHALQKISAGELEMPWPIRHRIAVGTSQGLSYLHFLSNPRIVHRDLKPSNILLDGSFIAHVSDFGLAKVIPGADTHVSTGVAGTVGYIAPEYSQTCRFTDKSDVYSFGVVLAVLLTGKDPTDHFFHTVPGGSIGSWLHDLLQKGEGRDAIDPKLLTETSFEEEILLAMKIAVFCTLANPNDRPSSKEVLIMLTQIRKDES